MKTKIGLIFFIACCTAHSLTIQEHVFSKQKAIKPWTIVIYAAADNNLYPFVLRNIEQMKNVGSNKNINILVHLHVHKKGERKVSKCLYIKKGKAIQIGPDKHLDSGNEKTLIDATTWAIRNFPSEHLAIVLWNHGSGDLNPFIRRSIDPSPLFSYNQETKKVEVNREVSYLDLVSILEHDRSRGICFDESTGNYLNDQKLKHAFEVTCKEFGKKIDLLLYDACLMAGTGSAWLAHHYADYMVASQEVVLGPGYNYNLLLKDLANDPMDPKTFACNAVDIYRRTYSRITDEYTHSALDLAHFPELTNTIDHLAKLLHRALEMQKNSTVKSLMQTSASSAHCTYFNEPTYIDFDHFLDNMLHDLAKIKAENDAKTAALQDEIRQALHASKNALQKTIIANVAGKRFRHAAGLSAYFPKRRMHASYPHTEFAQNNNWLALLKKLLIT